MLRNLISKESLRNNLTDNENRLASLSEVHASIHVPEGVGFWKKLMAFTGPGLMVAVGYIDPGNWATDIEGGSRFGYALLSVILISNLFAMLLQHLALKLGIAAGRDLAQACRDYYSKPVSMVLWVLCEIAIAATDLAEVIEFIIRSASAGGRCINRF
jgi:manganese transport protein